MKKQTLSTIIFLALLASSASAQQGEVHTGLPAQIDRQAHYVFYLHGRIIETAGRRPTHPEFGVYQYDGILQALAREGFQVVSEARPADTGIGAYARKVAGQVRSLIGAGVAPARIAVVGFSKGGLIAIATSSLVGEPDVRYVFLAACGTEAPEFRVSGRVLSIHEASDEIGLSCQPLFDRSPEAKEPREIRIETGKRHGAFYRPIPEWLTPTVQWIKGEG